MTSAVAGICALRTEQVLESHQAGKAQLRACRIVAEHLAVWQNGTPWIPPAFSKPAAVSALASRLCRPRPLRAAHEASTTCAHVEPRADCACWRRFRGGAICRTGTAMAFASRG